MTDTASTIPNIAPDYSAQCARIAEKLVAARRYDIQRKVSGADHHEYEIGPVLSEDAIQAFEETHSIKLPAPYAAFLTKVGHAGPLRSQNTAGPFYGLLPLDQTVTAFGADIPPSLADMPAMNARMSDEYWDELTDPYHQDDLPSDERTALKAKALSGLLPIGPQGGALFAALVLNGPDRGRIVNIDAELHPPVYAFEANFLDWYERWLDEVLSGVLITDKPTSFGYTMGGTDEDLLAHYFKSADREQQLLALEGIFKLPRMRVRNGDVLLKICRSESGEHRLVAFELLIKNGFYNWAKDDLKGFLHGSELDFHVACKALLDHADYHATDWADVIGARLPSLTDANAFGVASSLLAKADGNWSHDVLDFVDHREAGFRYHAMKALGAMDVASGPVKAAFMKGMADQAPGVVAAAIAAHETDFSDHFVSRYYDIAKRTIHLNADIEEALSDKIMDLGYDNRAEFIQAYEAGELDACTLASLAKEASKLKDAAKIKEPADIGEQADTLTDRLKRYAKGLIRR
ncbi:MAG: SMI1/KNR4 family protein [Pseudomonadota bacterium]